MVATVAPPGDGPPLLRPSQPSVSAASPRHRQFSVLHSPLSTVHILSTTSHRAHQWVAAQPAKMSHLAINTEQGLPDETTPLLSPCLDEYYNVSKRRGWRQRGVTVSLGSNCAATARQRGLPPFYRCRSMSPVSASVSPPSAVDSADSRSMCTPSCTRSGSTSSHTSVRLFLPFLPCCFSTNVLHICSSSPSPSSPPHPANTDGRHASHVRPAHRPGLDVYHYPVQLCFLHG